jgi:flagellar assembly factor FliW
MTSPSAPNLPTRVETAFGTFQVGDQDVLEFPAGMPGFEQCRRFVLLSSDDLAPFQCLQSVDGPAASFLVIDPRRALHDYRCALSDTDRLRLGGAADDTLLWAAIVTVQADRTHVNLRAPVVINPALMVGYQLMPSNSLYPLRFELTRLPATAAGA